MVSQTFVLCERRIQRQECLCTVEGFSKEGRPGSHYPRQFFLLSGDCPELLWPDRGTVGSGWTDGRRQSALAPGHHRKAFRARPGLGEDVKRPTTESCERKADLSHRSLSGQGNGPEHFGVSIRQWNLRAHLESPLYRSHSDFGGGNRGSGAARQLLRSGRGVA